MFTAGVIALAITNKFTNAVGTEITKNGLWTHFFWNSLTLFFKLGNLLRVRESNHNMSSLRR